METGTVMGNLQKATLAGGCFWCLESAFADMPGVVKTVVGYAGGTQENPTYEEVLEGNTGHREAIRIAYDPETVSYNEILVRFFSQIDPTDYGGQFSDRGFSYTTAIWYHTEEQHLVALESIERLKHSSLFKAPIVTEILPYSTFFPAEEYHQKYYKKSSFRYKLYRKGSGREDFIKREWTPEAVEYLKGKDAFLAKKYKKPSDEYLKKKLSDISYEVTQKGGTETRYSSKFATNWEQGIYVDVASGEPLFSSSDQYDSGCGWLSFTKPISTHFIRKYNDTKYGMPRTEVRSKYGNSHLGHLFNDGPTTEGGFRYCINGAALRFIPKQDLEKEGYGEFKEFLSEANPYLVQKDEKEQKRMGVFA